MTMKIVFIKEYKGFSLDGTKGIDEYQPLDEAFVIRKFGQKMIMNEFAIPEFRKELNPEYKRLVKEKEKWEKKQNAAKDVVEKDAVEKEKPKPKKRKYRKKTTSMKAETRETGVLTE